MYPLSGIFVLDVKGFSCIDRLYPRYPFYLLKKIIIFLKDFFLQSLSANINVSFRSYLFLCGMLHFLKKHDFQFGIVAFEY